MHELSLCKSISDVVNRHAEGRRVSAVRLQVGHFRQVVPDSLEYCWGLVSGGTSLADAKLEIEMIPAKLKCTDCEFVTSLDVPIFICGSCQSQRVDLISGEEFMIQSIDLLEENP